MRKTDHGWYRSRRYRSRSRSSRRSGGGKDYVSVHQVFDDDVVIAQKQILDSDDALQLSVHGGDKADVNSWKVCLSDKYNRQITAKDNVRDSYFMGLGMYYEDELLTLKNKLTAGEIEKSTYKQTLFEKMNDTNAIPQVQKLLEKMRGNLYGLETDEGKLDIITGRFDISYQWSGDAVYILDSGEDEEMTDTPVYLEYCIPQSASNLFFDGWVMMKDANEHAATAFINYLSMPENAVRNMDYIGYTSCIASDTVFEYITEKYGASDEESEPYDLS